MERSFDVSPVPVAGDCTACHRPSRDTVGGRCAECRDSVVRPVRVGDASREDYQRVANLKPTKVFGGFEYWVVGNEVYRNRVGNRGPIEPIGNSGKPQDARWECSVNQLPLLEKMNAQDASQEDPHQFRPKLKNPDVCKMCGGKKTLPCHV